MKAKERKKIFGNESCYSGQLTKKGIKSMIKCGEDLRHRYVTQYKLLPSVYISENVNIRSTFTPRTLETSQAIMLGLYPKKSRSSSDFVFVSVLDKKVENMYPRLDICDKLKILRKEIVSSNEEKQRKVEIKKIIANNMKDSLEYWNTRAIAGFTNTLESIIGNEVDLDLDSRVLEQARKISGERYIHYYSRPDIARLSIGTFLQDIIEDMESFLIYYKSNENVPKFRLYAGHDNTLGPLMASLNVSDGLHPQMGSAFIIELYKKKKSGYILF